MASLYQHIAMRAVDAPPSIIVGVQRYEFAAIESHVARLAACLARHGVLPGDRLMVQLSKSVWNVFLYLACLRSGIIMVPLNSGYTDEELTYFLSDAEPRAVVCDPDRYAVMDAIPKPPGCLVLTLDGEGKGTLVEGGDVAVAMHPCRDEDVAVILYTSGTTGKPKGAMLTHGGLYANAMTLNAVWGITKEDVLLHMLPLFHVHGLFFALHTLLLAGGTIHLVPKFDADLFFKGLPECTVFMGVPTYYARLLQDARLTHESCRAMRLFISGSAPLLPAVFEAFYERTGHRLLERYGMTETGINSSNPLQGARKVGTVGLPLPGVAMRVADAQHQPLLVGEVGAIQVQGAHLFSGYWRKPEKTREEFTPDGYFNTGDLGFWDEEGYLTIVGRSKDMVITGGLNVYPKEIETSLDAMEGVVESAVIGVPHPEWGEMVVAVVAGDASQLDEQRLMAALRTHHAAYKCPKKIWIVESLPKNTMGKVQKNLLREQYAVEA